MRYSLRNIVSNLRSRLGDFWWYSFWVFVALRLGDLINAFIGLWLVPRYVPQGELGAVLPLTQMVGFLGLPMSVAVVVLTKFVNEYATKNEIGKVKSILRVFIGTAGTIMILTMLGSFFLLPSFFDRIRVENGSLSLLIVMSCLIGGLCPMFTNALQGLKKFNAITLTNFLAAPVRLITMLITLPIRALSGYMLGQISGPMLQIFVSCFALRKEMGRKIRATPFWNKDWHRLLKYTVMIALSYSGGSVLAFVQPLIIRQRLPELDSAAYYMISRFAELATYAGATLSFMIFPFAAEAHVRGKEQIWMLYRSALVIGGFGLFISCILYFWGGQLLSINSLWRGYSVFSSDMALLALTLTINSMSGVFVAYEGANERFSYLWYNIPICLIQSAYLVCFFGYGFFRGIISETWMAWLDAHDILTLRTYLIVNFIFAGIMLLLNIGHLISRSFNRIR